MSEPVGTLRLDDFVVDVPDYPQPGIVFKDVTPLFADAGALHQAIGALVAPFTGAVDRVAGIEARGFAVGAPVALALGVGFAPIRKAGKLPRPTIARDYDLEYGTARLEMHVDGVHPGERVLVVDDVLATGGTAAAAADLIREAGAVPVALGVLLELAFLHGRERLAPLPVHSLVVA